MKKTLLAAALLLTSLSANAYRQEYGTFGGWDAYYLNTGSQEVCASRGFFDNGYKVIFNWSKENNIHTLSINLEHYGWSIPPGRYAPQYGTTYYAINSNTTYDKYTWVNDDTDKEILSNGAAFRTADDVRLAMDIRQEMFIAAMKGALK